MSFRFAPERERDEKGPHLVEAIGLRWPQSDRAKERLCRLVNELVWDVVHIHGANPGRTRLEIPGSQGPAGRR